MSNAPKLAVVVFGLVWSLCVPAAASAALIGTTSFSPGGGTVDPFTALTLGLEEYAYPLPSPILGGPSIFEGRIVTPADVGTTVYEDGTTDSDFAAIVGLLTNGLNDLTFLRVNYVPFTGAGGGSGGNESGMFTGPGILNGIDFAGQAITRIGLRIDSLSFFLDEEELHAYEGTFTILVEDSRRVPEPVTGSLLLIGATAFALRLLRRRNSRISRAKLFTAISSMAGVTVAGRVPLAD